MNPACVCAADSLVEAMPFSDKSFSGCCTARRVRKPCESGAGLHDHWLSVGVSPPYAHCYSPYSCLSSSSSSLFLSFLCVLAFLRASTGTLVTCRNRRKVYLSSGPHRCLAPHLRLFPYRFQAESTPPSRQGEATIEVLLLLPLSLSFFLFSLVFALFLGFASICPLRRHRHYTGELIQLSFFSPSLSVPLSLSLQNDRIQQPQLQL